MLKDEITELINSVFKEAKLEIRISDLFLYRPVVHELPFENLEPIQDSERLRNCGQQIFLEIEIAEKITTIKQPERDKERILSYHIECKKDGNKFSIGNYFCTGANYYPDETPKDIDAITEKIAVPVFNMILRILHLFTKG